MITRRAFLKSSGLGIFAIGLGGVPTFLLRAANNMLEPTLFKKRKTLIAIFQRGAMDGLMAVPPFQDKYLQKARPKIWIPSPTRQNNASLLDIDGRFGLHPSLSPFAQYFKTGQLAIVHGVGSPNSTRSHFDAQDYMETATPGKKSTTSGWLNRAVGIAGHEANPFQAVSITKTLPLSLHGDASALAIDSLEEAGAISKNKKVGQSLEALYQQTTQNILKNTAQESFGAAKMLEQLSKEKYMPANGAKYPKSPLGTSLLNLVRLIKANVGLEVGFAETGGWDTHFRQGNVKGSFARRAEDLAKSIDAFWTDLGTYQDDVTILTMTEFGRTVAENGSNGTDHGRASCFFVLGNDVKGGKVYGKVPELAPENLADGRDLPVTTDFRAVFSEIAGDHLGIYNDDTLFPGWNGNKLDIMKRA